MENNHKDTRGTECLKEEYESDLKPLHKSNVTVKVTGRVSSPTYRSSVCSNEPNDMLLRKLTSETE